MTSTATPQNRPSPPTKRRGLETSASRAALMDAAESVILEQGIAGVTSRTVATKAGFKPQLIHYYFSSVENLYIEVFRRAATRDLAQIADVLEGGRPLAGLWKLISDPGPARLVTEMLALANRNVVIRSEITSYVEERREFLATAVSRHLAVSGSVPAIPPRVIAILLETIGGGLALESALEISLGHDETRDAVGVWVGQLSCPPVLAHKIAAR